jgi:hypothetical protein
LSKTNKLIETTTTTTTTAACHDNPVFEKEISNNNDSIIDTQTTKIVITAINKNQVESIHLNQARINTNNKSDLVVLNETNKYLEQESILNNGSIRSQSNTSNKLASQQEGGAVVAAAAVVPAEDNTSSSSSSSIRASKRLKQKVIYPTYNTADKLAAAAAVVSSTTADTLVEIPNFGQSLSSMMDHNKMVSKTIIFFFISIFIFFSK